MMATIEKPLTGNVLPDGTPLDLRGYEQAGGYQAIRRVLSGGMTPKAVTELVKNANLRGRGGAGFQTGLKWSFVPTGPDVPNPTYLVVNADEMEPGTFKDRFLMERNPHQLIEGAITAGFAIEADIAFMFLRGEYALAAERLSRAIAEAYERHYLGKNILGSGYSMELYLHLSGGRYICGDETGLLNALEGKRANPRAKPPFPVVVGLFGKASRPLGTPDGDHRARDSRGARRWHARRAEISRVVAWRQLHTFHRRRAPGYAHGLHRDA